MDYKESTIYLTYFEDHLITDSIIMLYIHKHVPL